LRKDLPHSLVPTLQATINRQLARRKELLPKRSGGADESKAGPEVSADTSGKSQEVSRAASEMTSGAFFNLRFTHLRSCAKFSLPVVGLSFAQLPKFDFLL
jgi:hypothetical protein